MNSSAHTLNPHHDSGAYVAHLRQIDTSSLPADGGERFNRLIFARSPYLLQHAENPVAWYEWGEEAFRAARENSLPVLVSIGYATCHWCHVMARESFEDREVADLLNRHFICIKVDREERPDIDDYCMAVATMMTGSGGWPLNVFMTADKRPFFAMTYLPRHRRQGMTGLIDLLANIAVLWRQQPDRIEQNCRQVMDELAAQTPDSERETPVDILAQQALQQLEKMYDTPYGGFGRAPKFPMPIYLTWLLRRPEEEHRTMALQSLRMMHRGGIRDHLGGGLHRYSTDREWLAPHFEKMLYDQAMIALAAADGWCVSGDDELRRMAEGILSFVSRELTSPEGGFFAALDADSEGHEGTFYLWDQVEVAELLGDQSDLFCRFYDITPAGNFEGRNILRTLQTLEDFCRLNGLEPADMESRLERCRAILTGQRDTRIRPLRDEKIIIAWNGLMIAAFARCGVLFDRREYINQAEQAARFVLNNLSRPDGRLQRSFLGSASETPAFLDDYASLCYGLLELYNAILDPFWSTTGLRIADDMVRLFRDPATSLFQKTGLDAEQMPGSVSHDHDGVTPSPFSLAAACLIRLSHITDRPDLRGYAAELLRAPLTDAARHAASQLGALMAQDLLITDPPIITVTGDPESTACRELIKHAALLLTQQPIIRHDHRDNAPSGYSLCANGTCYPPVIASRDCIQLLTSVLS